MSRCKSKLEPRQSGRLDFFVCGPTVYDWSHLGHAKTYTQFDFIVRYLRNRGYEVFYLQNITDIDDKIIERARLAGLSPAALAEKFTEYFLEDMMALHNTNVTKYARAHDFIPEIVDQIKRLITKGHAYWTQDGYYFDLSSFAGYGKLSQRREVRPEDAISRVDENPFKRNPGDFCLWKARKPDEPFWDTELGQGRPGWHIEDTAIAEHFFGPQYDLHGGAVDLIFPHHEAEIAQMEAVSGREPMVRYWLHSGLLKVRSQKMSKSLGNLVTIREALQSADYRTLRFWFLSHHYRSPMEFNEGSIPQAKAALQRIESFVRSIEPDRDDPENDAAANEFRCVFYGHLDDDFDTPRAFAALFEFIHRQNRLGATGARVYEVMREVNTLFDFIVFDWRGTDAEIERLVKWRQDLRKSKRFAEADEIRRRLSAEGVVIEDTARGVRWFRRPH